MFRDGIISNPLSQQNQPDTSRIRTKMTEPLLIARNNEQELYLLPQMANRHGLITGATGTGKTVTLQTLAESFSRIGVPVFLSDIKGDLSGISKIGGGNAKSCRAGRAAQAGNFTHRAYPVTFWDVFGAMGHPLRATVSDMGPLLLGRMLNLNEVQQGVMALVFKIADDNGLLLLDLKDLRAMVRNVGDNAAEFTTEYGNISTASIGAIQRGLLQIETQGGDSLFGEPMLNIADLMQTDSNGYGMINILAADKLMTSPRFIPRCCCGCSPNCSRTCRKRATLPSPKWCFSSTKRTCCSTMRPPRCSTRSNRWYA